MLPKPKQITLKNLPKELKIFEKLKSQYKPKQITLKVNGKKHKK